MTEVQNQTGSESDSNRLVDVVRELPDEVLIGELAGRINPNPSGEIRAVMRASQQSFSGPIPPPQMLEQYDGVKNGMADRIVKMAEDPVDSFLNLELSCQFFLDLAGHTCTVYKC